MHNISKAQNRLFNIILRIDNCLRHIRIISRSLPLLPLRSLSLTLHIFLQSEIASLRPATTIIEEDTPKTNDDNSRQRRRQQQQCRSKGGSSCEPRCVCVRVCVCFRVHDWACLRLYWFFDSNFAQACEPIFRSYIIHACVCVCVCICIATFIRGVFFCLFCFCRWAATGALCLKVIRGTIFLALCSKEAAAATTTTNNNRRCKITFGSCASLLQQKRSTNTNTTTATTTRDALCKWNDALWERERERQRARERE